MIVVIRDIVSITTGTVITTISSLVVVIALPYIMRHMCDTWNGSASCHTVRVSLLCSRGSVTTLMNWNTTAGMLQYIGVTRETHHNQIHDLRQWNTTKQPSIITNNTPVKNAKK